MIQENNLPSWKKTLENICIFFSILAAVVLLIVWALADTIAARNISIVVGLVASTGWVLLVRPNITRSDLIVPVLLMGVPIWLWVIYFFFPIDAAAQYKEMTGTWMRVMLLITFGFNLGLIISKNNKLAIWIWLAFASLPIAALVDYLLAVSLGYLWNALSFTSFFKTKVAGVYFLMLPCLFGFASLNKNTSSILFESSDSKSLSSYFPSIIIIICFYMFYVTHALTGILVASFLLIILIAIILNDFSSSKKIKLAEKIVVYLLCIVAICSAIVIANKYDAEHQNKLTYIFKDSLFAMDIDRHSAWKELGGSSSEVPERDNGRVVNGSTYERVSWFIKGAQFFLHYPFGSGDPYFSFGKYMRIEYPGSLTTKTHCGWLDFALGVGFVGLFFIWSAIFIVMIKALKASTQFKFFSMACIWILGGIWILWWPAELSYREFIEHYIFLVAIFGGIFCKER